MSTAAPHRTLYTYTTLTSCHIASTAPARHQAYPKLSPIHSSPLQRTSNNLVVANRAQAVVALSLRLLRPSDHFRILHQWLGIASSRRLHLSQSEARVTYAPTSRLNCASIRLLLSVQSAPVEFSCLATRQSHLNSQTYLPALSVSTT